MASNISPNAKIESWIKEWRDEAQKNGHQSHFAMTKALLSLRAYPLPLESGKDAAILKNFGPALCKMIDERLKKERKNNPSGDLDVEDSWDSEVPAPKTKSIKHSVQEVGNDSEMENSPRPSSKKKPKTGGTKSGREYLPSYRSAGFAILLTLLEHSRDTDAQRSFMTKSEIMETAQRHCDTSFKPQSRGGMPTGPNSFYSAWSSMSTLTKKLLVNREGNPARFTLTEAGKQLAEKLESGADGRGCDSSQSSQVSASSSKSTALSQGHVSSMKVMSTYVKCESGSDSDSERPKSKSTKSRKKTVASSSKPIVLGSSSSSSAATSSQPLPSFSQKTISVSSTSSDMLVAPKLVRTASTSSTSSRQPLETNETLIEEVFHLLASEADNLGALPWEVILCVDNQEYYGSSNKKNIIADLGKLGVKTEVRRLSVGDYLWVLRRRPDSSSQNNEDFVLDYVIERKRIDDLVSSVVDGRFKEQKARMKNSSRRKTIYLIEEYTAWSANSSSWRFSINPSSLLQSVVNTLLIDEFELKMTRDGHHTAVMLGMLGKQIEKAVAKVAAKCRDEFAFTFEEKSALLTHPIALPARFNEWNAASSKRRPMTIQEIFTRQLMCIQGISADRAVAITTVYPIPASLLDACSLGQSDCEKSLAALKIGTRKLGPAVAKRIVSYYSKF